LFLVKRLFNDLSKGNFGPPNRYIILQRIEYTKSLLETRRLTVNEVAAHCGFSDVYYFSKTFKQICGISPSKWLWNSKSSSVKHFRFCFHFAQFKVLKIPVMLHKKPI
jgi:AraC-like DNA-binding protein